MGIMKRYEIELNVKQELVFGRFIWVNKKHTVEADSYNEARRIAREIYQNGKNITIKEKKDE